MTRLAPLLISLALITSAAQSQVHTRRDESDNEVIIKGQRRTSQDAGLPGRGVVFTPTDSTQKDLTTLLSSEASVEFVDDGRVNGSGFLVPRLRGHDTRATEIWIDDFLVQDPLSGLPIVDEIDLRAFGTVRLMRGISPLNIHSAHQRGVIQFTPDFSGKTIQRSAGITYGKPYGVSGFGLVTNARPKSGPAYRIFAREHFTKGNFSYYNDQATPYNTSDDTYETRNNNHRHSRMITPFLRWGSGQHLWKLSAVLAESESGIPSQNPHLRSYASDENEQALVSTSYTYLTNTQSTFLPSQLQLKGQLDRGLNRVRNQSADQFGYSGDREIARRGTGGEGGMRWDLQRGQVEIAVRDHLTKITLDDEQVDAIAAWRSVTTAYAGADIYLLNDLRLFQKLQIIRNNDRMTQSWNRDQSRPADFNVSKNGHASLTAVAYEFAIGSTYIQYGRSQRLPSLLESFGDGGRIRPNLSLKSEREEHREIGFTLKASDRVRASASTFRDTSNERIIFLPSIGETSRATNLSQTSVSGYELQASAEAGGFEAAASWTGLQPVLRLTNGAERKVPTVADHQGAATVGTRLEGTSIRWQSRYRGDVWRDEDNSIRAPATLFHDAFIDHEERWETSAFRVGFSVINIFNLRKASLTADQSPDGNGKTAVSDIAGSPLPGRQVKATLEYQW